LVVEIDSLYVPAAMRIVSSFDAAPTAAAIVACELEQPGPLAGTQRTAA
jgi:hypothetical protein